MSTPKTNLTGYSYIDEEIDRIKNNLPKEKQEKFDKIYKEIYSLAFCEGYTLKEKEVLEVIEK
jgi:hypothetical protein